MKKRYGFPVFLISFLFIQFGALKIYALDYTISFTGTGASTSVESVIVQNLTKGTMVTVPAGNVLNLSENISSVSNPSKNIDCITVYPNPIKDQSTVSFFATHAGKTQINVFGLDGRKIISQNRTLQQGDNSFKFSIRQGTYVLQIIGDGFSYNSKVVSRVNCQVKPQISFTEDENQSTNKPQKSKSVLITMLYNNGDQLLYKGISGNYTTIVPDKPITSKTINFNFVECKDGAGNYYATVKIGNQTWMAENLKTIKYRNGIAIDKITDNLTWGYTGSGAWCDYNNHGDNKYGKLYNSAAVTNINNISPAGWHVAVDADWTTLENYLITNGGNYDGSSTNNKIAKALASDTEWLVNSNAGAIGNNKNLNNSTGFNALPGGFRYAGGRYEGVGIQGSWWSISSTNNAWRRDLYNDGSSSVKWDYNDYIKNSGYSIRCIKD